MKIKRFVLFSLFSIFSLINVFAQESSLSLSQEKRLRNVKQLTFGGENAEAYFSFDGKRLIFQSKREPYQCDQIFTMNVDGSNIRRVSNGEGRTTCSYFFKNGKRVLFASTHTGAKECPPPVDYSKGYAWAIYPSYDIFTAKSDGADLKALTNAPGYDAEATVSPNGKQIVFHLDARR